MQKGDPTGYIASGIVNQLEDATTRAKDEDWYEDAEDDFKKAIKIKPDLGESYYRLGYLYKVAYKFRDAEDQFKKVLETKNGYEKEADDQWKTVQRILRAAPGTRVGSKIALIEKITRADIAALFIAELELDRIMEKRKAKQYDTDFETPADAREMQVDTLKKMAAITDISDHWAKNFIEDMQKYQIRGLEPTPDHKFHPGEFITRAQYSMFIEDILIAITGDRSLASKYVGASESRFPDVNPATPYYNAICNAVDKNIMDANLAGEFLPLATVDGPDALLIIRKIKELRR
jgi:tetratricopeptide (TPR) repeat protein